MSCRPGDFRWGKDISRHYATLTAHRSRRWTHHAARRLLAGTFNIPGSTALDRKWGLSLPQPKYPKSNDIVHDNSTLTCQPSQFQTAGQAHNSRLAASYCSATPEQLQRYHALTDRNVSNSAVGMTPPRGCMVPPTQMRPQATVKHVEQRTTPYVQ